MGYWAAIGAVAGGLISSSGQKSTDKANAAARDAAYKKALGSINKLTGQAADGNFHGYGMEDIFGSKVDPEAALYHPVDISNSQAQSIGGNLANFESASALANFANEDNQTQDLKRINRLFPGFDQNMDKYSGITSSLLSGQNPFGNEDVLDIVSDRQSLSGTLGTPGGAGNATLKDLGLNRLDLASKGAGMFTDWVKTADAVNPVNSQFRAQQSFLTPSERLDADIRQRENEQSGILSAAYLAASPDPGAAGLFNLDFSSQVGLGSAMLGSAVNLSNPYAALGQGVSNAATAYGQYRQGQQRQNQYGYGAGTYTPQQQPAYYAGGYSQDSSGVYPKASVVA